jgi:hypothetical protein
VFLTELGELVVEIGPPAADEYAATIFATPASDFEDIGDIIKATSWDLVLSGDCDEGHSLEWIRLKVLDQAVQCEVDGTGLGLVMPGVRLFRLHWGD